VTVTDLENRLAALQCANRMADWLVSMDEGPERLRAPYDLCRLADYFVINGASDHEPTAVRAILGEMAVEVEREIARMAGAEGGGR
jgi:hypothetical protein